MDTLARFSDTCNRSQWKSLDSFWIRHVSGVTQCHDVDVSDENEKKSPYTQAVGEVIRLGRLKAKLTQTELGALVGLDRQTVARFEKGLRAPDTEVLERIASVFQILPSDIFMQAQAEMEGLVEVKIPLHHQAQLDQLRAKRSERAAKTMQTRTPMGDA